MGQSSLNYAYTSKTYREDTVKLDLRPLLAGEELLTFDYELPLNVDPEDTSSFLYGVSFPSPMKVKGEITNTSGYMTMTLTVSVDYQAECARCLDKVTGCFSLDLEKTVATKKQAENLEEKIVDDYCIIEDGFLDIDEPLKEQIEIEFPFRILCKDDCKGLCEKCGKNLNHGECGCVKKEIDPRLAPLQKILEQMKNEENNNK